VFEEINFDDLDPIEEELMGYLRNNKNESISQ
jgi:hypothetical protein